MRLNLRLTNPDSGRSDHVVLTTEPDALVDDVVRALNTIQPGTAVRPWLPVGRPRPAVVERAA